MKSIIAHPILTCKQASEFESTLLNNDQNRIWEAMSSVGYALTQEILINFQESFPFPNNATVLLLLGKGHNSGDTLLAASNLLDHFPNTKIFLYFTLGKDNLKPLVQKSLDVLTQKTTVIEITSLSSIQSQTFTLCIDGILGMSFTPPLREPIIEIINTINKNANILFRAAVDIPSGLSESGGDTCFQADFTYATGVAKTPLFNTEFKNAIGRIRYLDIGFFKDPQSAPSTNHFILHKDTLKSLSTFRNPNTDKRHYGHLLVLAGSIRYPGALVMALKVAASSGVGLLTACALESFIPSFAPHIPESMWLPMPQTPSGTIDYLGKHEILQILPKISAILIGPGLGDASETHQLIHELVKSQNIPMIIDASALTSELTCALQERPRNFARIILTPHPGEFLRLAGEGNDLLQWSQNINVTTLLKGPHSQIAHDNTLYINTYGGPLLARGGSGDILSGLIGGLLAQTPQAPLTAVSKAVLWHSLTADYLARHQGQVATHTTQLIPNLHKALREI